jgi:hypothetical protein
VVAIENYMDSHAIPEESLEAIEIYPHDCDQEVQLESFPEVPVKSLPEVPVKSLPIDEFPPPRLVDSYQLDNSEGVRMPDFEDLEKLLEQSELKL